MTKKEFLLWCVLFDFVALTGYAVYTEGYFAFVPLAAELFWTEIWGAQIIFDFLIALAIALGFMAPDAKARGLAFWPFAAMTLFLGSIGPLAYLIHRERAANPREERAGAAAQHA